MYFFYKQLNLRNNKIRFYFCELSPEFTPGIKRGLRLVRICLLCQRTGGGGGGAGSVGDDGRGVDKSR